jgi:RNA polymerase sigma-70 factor (TIGR02960 family)
MSAELMEQARGGDADAFTELVRPYRGELQLHCYRILGSMQDAEDALQESLLAAWQAFAGFEARSSMRTWLYRIATNKALDAFRAVVRRPEVTARPAGIEPPEPTRRGEIAWLQPYPDVLLENVADSAPGPDVVLESREATSLAFVTALQLLPARQRAVLILRDVLGFRASEVAAMLDATQESVTSALKRARAALTSSRGTPGHHLPPPAPGSAAERRVVDQFVAAFAAKDVGAIVALLTEDAWVKMPPMPFEYQGRQAAARFFTAIMSPGQDLRYVITRANGQPAFAAYVADPVSRAWRSAGLIVIAVEGDEVSEVIRFDAAVLASFGLPRILPGEAV